MHKNKIHVFCLVAVLLVIYFWGIFESQAQLIGRMFKGEEVVVTLGKVSTRNLKVGDKVEARVRDPVEKGGDTYISQRELVWAHVKSLKKPGIYGKKAKLVVAFDSTKSTGGTTIPLAGGEYELEGEGKGILPYLLFPIGWLFKGSHIETTVMDSLVTVTYVDVSEYIDIDI